MHQISVQILRKILVNIRNLSDIKISDIRLFHKNNATTWSINKIIPVSIVLPSQTEKKRDEKTRKKVRKSERIPQMAC